MVSVAGASNFEGTSSGDPNYLLFAINLSEPASIPVTVGYRLLSGTASVGGDVYDYFSGDRVTFAVGETSKTVAWRIDGDAEIEADEAVVLEGLGRLPVAPLWLATPPCCAPPVGCSTTTAATTSCRCSHRVR